MQDNNLIGTQITKVEESKGKGNQGSKKDLKILSITWNFGQKN